MKYLNHYSIIQSANIRIILRIFAENNENNHRTDSFSEEKHAHVYGETRTCFLQTIRFFYSIILQKTLFS